MFSFDSTVNDKSVSVKIAGHESAVEVLREQLGLTGTKLVCASGVCGACTVKLDGDTVAGCLTPAAALRNASVTTVEGIGKKGALHPIQKAFMAHDGLQCGYCTPGFIVSAASFVDSWRKLNGDVAPDRVTIAEALAGHLCRCGAYEGIYKAVAAACAGEHDGPKTSPARVDSEQKVTGKAKYTADRYPSGALEAVIVRSKYAAGTVGPIDVSLLDKSQGEFYVDLLSESRRIRWAGQPIAAVAAATLEKARNLAGSLEPTIDKLPFVTDPQEAKASNAPQVFDGREDRKAAGNAAEGPVAPSRWSGNVRGPNPAPLMGTLAKNRIKKARQKNSAGLVEMTLSTSPQLHTSFEPHCTVADWTDPSFLRVWTSTQSVDLVAHELAERYELNSNRVEVIADYVGGGFGSKLPVSVDILAAVELSRKAQKPVRLVLDRREELTATGNRPGSKSDIKILVADDGDLKSVVLGAESHGGMATNGLYGALAMMLYGKSPRVATDSDVVTNAPPGSPFRGPGGPTYAWALEQAVDQAAHQLRLDPIELRQKWDGNERRQALYEWAAKLDVWKTRPPTGASGGRYLRGVGFAAANWLYMVDPDTEVRVGVERGQLFVETASQDIGTGSKTVLANAVAEVFNTNASQIEVRMGRAGLGRPHGPTSGGSRVTPSIWSAAVEAATELHQKVGGEISENSSRITATARRGRDKRIRPIPVTLRGVQIGRGFSAAVHVSEVEVDTLTGKVRVLSVHGGIAAGVPHARKLAVSQCEGSIIQGIGLALYEGQVLDPHTGLTLSSNLEDYRIAQLGDMPEVEIYFHEAGWEHVPGGGVGLGEVSAISPAASVANAIFNAVGWRPTQAPVRPDRILKGLR